MRCGATRRPTRIDPLGLTGLDLVGPLDLCTTRTFRRMTIRLDRAERVARDRIDLEIYTVAGLALGERRTARRLGDERDRKRCAVGRGDREADPVERDESLLDDIQRQLDVHGISDAQTRKRRT